MNLLFSLQVQWSKLKIEYDWLHSRFWMGRIGAWKLCCTSEIGREFKNPLVASKKGDPHWRVRNSLLSHAVRLNRTVSMSQLKVLTSVCLSEVAGAVFSICRASNLDSVRGLMYGRCWVLFLIFFATSTLRCWYFYCRQVGFMLRLQFLIPKINYLWALY